MSRSYKKTPIVKDGGHAGKQSHARAMRTNVHQILNVYVKTYGEHSEEPTFPHPFEITNPYDVCDWKFWISDEKHNRFIFEYGEWFIRVNGKNYLRK